jgi:hypothetical protein
MELSSDRAWMLEGRVIYQNPVDASGLARWVRYRGRARQNASSILDTWICRHKNPDLQKRRCTNSHSPVR